MSYKTSKDYERLWELVGTQHHNGIIGRWANRGDKQLHVANVTPIYDKQQTIECWENGGFEFIDPASQERPKVWHSPEEVPEGVAVRNSILYFDALGGASTLSSAPNADEWKYFVTCVVIVKWAYVDDLEGME